MERTRRRPACSIVAALLLVSAAPVSVAAPAEARCRRTTQRVAAGTWATRPVADLAGSPASWRMAVDERDPSLVVVADYRGVLVSDDGGCSWDRTLVFADASPPLALVAEDVDVAGRGTGRVVRVVATTIPDAGPRILSSSDDGRTWELTDAPAAATGNLDTIRASSSLRSPSTYLLTVHRTSDGGVFASEDGAPWEWRSVTAPEASSAACPPGGPCVAPPLRALQADPRDPATVWALAASSAAGGRRLMRSTDGGSTWSDLMAPGLLAGPTLMDVAPGRRVMLLDDFRHFAVSADAGKTWQVGEFPKLSAPEGASGPSFDIAHAGSGSFAVILGPRRGSPWSGNVFVFDGEEWIDASPPEFAGYERVDEDGAGLTFAELTSARDAFLMLSSRGELATFRPAS